MSLETLLEAAKYVEYRSEAKARGEEPHDYFTFSKLSAAGKDGLSLWTEQKHQPTLSNSSSEEIKEKRRSTTPLTRDSVLPNEHSGTGTREVHNKLEKNRRAHLKECFEALKKQLPNMDDRKTSNLSILRGAIRYIQTLKRKEREHEHDMERLAREKISFQQRLSTLRKDLSSQLEHAEAGGGSYVTPDNEDNETTTTASECGVLSDFDDSLPRDVSNAPSNVPSDLTSSSSSSTASGLIITTLPSTTTPKPTLLNAHVSVTSKEPAASPNGTHFSSDSVLALTGKSAFAAATMPSALSTHTLPNVDNCNTQTTRVFSANQLQGAMAAGLFAAPMQVVPSGGGGLKVIAPTTIVTPSSYGQIHVLAPSASANPTYGGVKADIHHKGKSPLMSPLTIVSPVVGLSQQQGMAMSKPMVNHTVADLTANASQQQQQLMKAAGSVLSIAVKNSGLVTSSPHPGMIATLHMSKPHPPHLIQSTLANNMMAQAGSPVNNGLKPAVGRALPHLVSQAPPAMVVGGHVSAVAPLVGPVSVVSHTATVMHHQPLGKVLATPVLKTVNQIPMQFLHQVASSSQPLVKPMVVVSVPSVLPTTNMAASSLVAVGDQASSTLHRPHK